MDTAMLPPDTEVGRVALTVANKESVVDFYRDIIGLSVTQSSSDRTVLGAGDADLLVVEHRSDAPTRDINGTGLYHVAFRVPSRAALGGALRRIDTEWTLSGAANHGVSEALYLSDPAGNGVEIYRDFPRKSWGKAPSGQVPIVTEPLDIDAVAAAGTGEESLPAESDIGHVHLEVSSLESARSFYVDALGLDMKTTYDGALFMAAGDYHHHIGANVWQGRSTPQQGQGLAWFELQFPDRQMVETVSEQVAEAGYEVDATDDEATVYDGDGIELRLRA